MTGCHHLNSSSETSLEQYFTVKCLLYPTSRSSKISKYGIFVGFLCGFETMVKLMSKLNEKIDTKFF